jgi:hypothetical protein
MVVHGFDLNVRLEDDDNAGFDLNVPLEDATMVMYCNA